MIAIAVASVAGMLAGLLAWLAGADLPLIIVAAVIAAVLVESVRDTVAGMRDRRHAYARFRHWAAADAERRFRDEVERQQRRRGT